MLNTINEYTNLTNPGGSPILANVMKADGKLSCGRVYDIFRPKQMKLPWGELLWFGLQSRKWGMIVWLASLDRLYTKARLRGWGMRQDSDCSLCGSVEETAQHLWFECQFTRDVASKVFTWSRIRFVDRSLREWLIWFVGGRGQKTICFQTKLLTFTGLIYFIWLVRNDVIFRNEVCNVDECTKRIIEGCKARIGAKGRFTREVDRRWKELIGL